MPVYEYQCGEHGVFTALRPMAVYGDPCACPVCGAAAPRVLLTAPRVGGATAQGRAQSINERAADSPRRMTAHGPGCGCCPAGNPKRTTTLNGPDGAKAFPVKRPWMISH